MILDNMMKNDQAMLIDENSINEDDLKDARS